jgi:hypothetical protein
VYELIGSNWQDQGTAFCMYHFDDTTQEPYLVARSEADFKKVVLQTTIRPNDSYQRQQDTLIVWTEPSGADYALSFQDPDGCQEIWQFISDVQALTAGDGELRPPSLRLSSAPGSRAFRRAVQHRRLFARHARLGGFGAAPHACGSSSPCTGDGHSARCGEAHKGNCKITPRQRTSLRLYRTTCASSSYSLWQEAYVCRVGIRQADD